MPAPRASDAQATRPPPLPRRRSSPSKAKRGREMEISAAPRCVSWTIHSSPPRSPSEDRAEGGDRLRDRVGGGAADPGARDQRLLGREERVEVRPLEVRRELGEEA